MNKSQEAFEKKKSIPKCISMPLTKCLDKNKEQNGVEEFDDYDIEENEMEEYMDNGRNHDSEEVEGTCANKAEGNNLGALSSGLIRKLGKTLCRKIHAREFKDRQEITLNEEGQPIGPDEKTVFELSSFLGTIGRSSDLCPLTFTSWIALVKFWEQHNIDPVWDYVNEKYNVPKEGRKADLSSMIKLQDLIENHGQPSSEAFESVFGKQKPGRMRCHGRTTTPSLLKRNEEIAKLKKEHADEVRQFNDKIQEIEEKHLQDKEEMERKMQLLLKTILNQNTSELNIEALTALISAPAADANSVLRSSASTHAPTNDKIMNDNINEDFQSFDDEET
ncbi:hypothetical protein KIW84_063611 [Lathyrus oleraceus]|uniref:Transposase n=1 Tax=Pisum sativum TaxID=3888 RepID=A0A9D4W9E4_PEA|nr:hypothetical protein KIW84_063611 [Pisum sativum]